MIDRRPIPHVNYSDGRQGHKVRWVILHHMDGTVESADAAFHNAANPRGPVSAHFGVGADGRTYEWVGPGDTAYQAGAWDANLESIGIEHEDFARDRDTSSPRYEFTDAQYAASAALVREMCAKYDIPVQSGSFPAISGVIRHGEVVATACPGSLDINRIVEEAMAVSEDEFKQYQKDVADTLNAMKAVYDPLVVRLAQVESELSGIKAAIK